MATSDNPRVSTPTIPSPVPSPLPSRLMDVLRPNKSTPAPLLPAVPVPALVPAPVPGAAPDDEADSGSLGVGDGGLAFGTSDARTDAGSVGSADGGRSGTV